MNPKLKSLVLMAVKMSGSYDPEKTLFYIEESLTGNENDLLEGFLKWCHKNKHTFGSGNIEAVWQQYRAK